MTGVQTCALPISYYDTNLAGFNAAPPNTGVTPVFFNISGKCYRVTGPGPSNVTNGIGVIPLNNVNNATVSLYSIYQDCPTCNGSTTAAPGTTAPATTAPGTTSGGGTGNPIPGTTVFTTKL